LSITDPNGLVTSLTYNFRGEPTTRTVGGEVTAYAYDPAGQLTKVIRPDGSFLTLTYDAAHRLIGINDAVAKVVVSRRMHRRDLDLGEIQGQAGSRRGKRRVFLLGFWRDEGPD
jgi:YD repeat-containing protein